MTFLERFKQEHPGFNGDDETVVRCACPEDFGYEAREGAQLCAAEAACSDDACAECWNRQADAAGVDPSSAADAAPSPQGEGKAPLPGAEARADEGIGPYKAMTGGEEAGADGV